MNALILVDIQNDFLPGGPLPATDGDAVIAPANALMEGGGFDLVVATQDWHPPDHGSFAVNHPGKKVGEQIDLNGLPQTLWPVHCVQNTRGAELAKALRRERLDKIVRKGTDPQIDSYSGFFDNGRRKSTELDDYLRSNGVTDVFVCGLTTDYCVKFTVLDALTLGFTATLIEDAIRGVDLRPTDSADAIEQMRRAGAQVATSIRFAARRP